MRGRTCLSVGGCSWTIGLRIFMTGAGRRLRCARDARDLTSGESDRLGMCSTGPPPCRPGAR